MRLIVDDNDAVLKAKLAQRGRDLEAGMPGADN
jgi:hypothetical protein